jgi:hypothetical protein
VSRGIKKRMDAMDSVQNEMQQVDMREARSSEVDDRLAEMDQWMGSACEGGTFGGNISQPTAIQIQFKNASRQNWYVFLHTIVDSLSLLPPARSTHVIETEPQHQHQRLR